MTLSTIFEYTTNGFLWESLDFLSVTAICAGIIVISIKNPIASLISLIGLFALIATYLIFCGLTFIGLSYLIVYIGAVSILFLFILMLINIRSSEVQSNNTNSIPLGITIVLLINYILSEGIPYSMAILNNHINQVSSLIYYTYNDYYFLVTNKMNDLIKFAVSNSWDTNISETNHISSIGNILYTSYNIWLFMASLILLLAMVGAIVVTLNKSTNKNRGINSMVEYLTYTQKVEGSNPSFLNLKILSLNGKVHFW
jgi:NADH-ubiquinone oxidoreductase chain 6